MKSLFRWCCGLLFIFAVVYGGVRLYFYTTHGFTIGNITSDFVFDQRWRTKDLSLDETERLDKILDQKFYYLGKGCQSYVFLSEDKKFVIKFFKYQRFRVPEWLKSLAFIPPLESHYNGKLQKKQNKLERFFSSWKIAFDELQPETGLVYVHLNKSSHLNKSLTIIDKINRVHKLNLDQMEFLVQRKATMLCDYIKSHMNENDVGECKKLIDKTILMILSENLRGFADNDHALMQNTGVLDGNPVHIDVGQFVRSEEIKDPDICKQELFNKTYKFRKWLRKDYPELANYLEIKLIGIIGDSFFQMQPHYKSHEV